MYNKQKGDRMGNIISINEKRIDKKISKIPSIFELDDVEYYFNLIEQYLKDLKKLAEEDEKYYNFCLDEEFKILSSVYESFMKILFDYYNNFDNYEESERVLGYFLNELYGIIKKLNGDDDCEDIKEEFELNDAIKYSNMIEYKLNELYDLSLKDKKYWVDCTNGQRNILIMIYSSFFKILSFEYEDFEKNIESNRVLSKFLTRLYLICDDIVDIRLLRKNIDKNVLKYETKKDKN